jgi:hypothetical protein
MIGIELSRELVESRNEMFRLRRKADPQAGAINKVEEEVGTIPE